MATVPEKYQLPVAYINQSEKWPTGCESVSAVMLLNFLNIPISVDDFIALLPKKAFRQENEFLIGADPSLCFVGSPYDADSFGCYSPVMMDTLNQVFALYHAPYRAKLADRVPTETLLSEYICEGLPVLYWSTIDLKPFYEGPSWYVETEHGLSEFTWRSNEHCMLLSGYDISRLFFHDPWENHGLIGYDRELVIKRHIEQYEMAVVIEKR